MPERRDVDLTPEVREYLNHISKDDPAGPEIWQVLEDYRRGERLPRQSKGSRALLERHRMPDGRIILLGMRFPAPNQILVTLIRVGKPRR